MELEGIPSIWDGWEEQIKWLRFGDGGRCALGWVDHCVYGSEQWLHSAENEPCIHPVYRRVAEYIKQRYVIPDDVLAHRDEPVAVIAYANNELGLTPEDFRRIDRLTQYEEGMRQIEQQIEEVRHDVSEVSA